MYCNDNHSNWYGIESGGLLYCRVLQSVNGRWSALNIYNVYICHKQSFNHFIPFYNRTSDKLVAGLQIPNFVLAFLHTLLQIYLRHLDITGRFNSSCPIVVIVSPYL